MSEASFSYAALILADAEQQITAEKLLAITGAAGASVESSWADVFAKALEGKDLKELLFSFAASAPSAAPAAGSGAAASGSSDAPAEEAAEEEKEESDDDMGFGLFD